MCVCVFRPNNRTSKQSAQRHNSSTVLSTNDVAGVPGNGISSSKLTLRDNWLAGESVAKATSDVTSLRPWSAMSSSSSTAVSSSQHKPPVGLLIHELTIIILIHFTWKDRSVFLSTIDPPFNGQ